MTAAANSGKVSRKLRCARCSRAAAPVSGGIASSREPAAQRRFRWPRPVSEPRKACTIPSTTVSASRVSSVVMPDARSDLVRLRAGGVFQHLVAVAVDLRLVRRGEELLALEDARELSVA